MNAEQIKDFRTRLGLSQEALAQAIGVSFQTVNRWERKNAKPSRLAVEKMKSLMAKENKE